MKMIKSALLSFMAVCLSVSFALAMHHNPEERGKALFNDPKLAGGKKACSSCHPDGRGLEKVGEKVAAKKGLMTPAGGVKTLEEAINICVVNANMGKALDTKSEDMKALVAYIKSLGKKAPKNNTPVY